MRLEDRVAVVTGGGSGIGKAICEGFAQEGAKVVINDLELATAEATLKGLSGSDHLAVAGDVTDSPRIAAIFAEVEERYGRCDILVNNAGVDRTPGDGSDRIAETGSMLLGMSDEGFRRMLDIHLNGAFYCAREAVRIMLKGSRDSRDSRGSIINLSSIAGLAGLGVVHYATAKGGVLGFTRSLARELGPRGIRVNAICPGVIQTPMLEAVPEALIEPMIASTPLRRVGEATEIATTALYLASDDSSYVTGQWISPNGGIHIQ